MPLESEWLTAIKLCLYRKEASSAGVVSVLYRGQLLQRNGDGSFDLCRLTGAVCVYRWDIYGDTVLLAAITLGITR